MHRLVDAELAVVGELLGRRHHAHRHDAEPGEVAAGGVHRAAQLGLRLAQAGAADRDPAVAVLGDVGEERGPGRTADQHLRARLLHRLRPLPARLEAHELAAELGHLLRPERLHRQHHLAHAGAAALGVDAVALHLLLVPAVADAEHHAAAGEPVERGDLLGQRDRIVLRHQRDAGAEPDPAGARRRRGERDIGIERALVLLGQHCVAGGRRRAPRGRDVRVLGDEERGEAARLGLDGELDRIHREIRREDRDSELHVILRSLRLAARRCAGLHVAGQASAAPETPRIDSLEFH